MTGKQTLFIEEYLKCWNASEAARCAGYSEAKNEGYRLLQRTDVRVAISKRVAEVAMSADEVLLRLAEHARGSLRPFIQQVGESIRVDVTEETRGDKPIHLIKALTTEHKTSSSEDGAEFESFKTRIELHDAQAALIQLGRYHGLFKDRVEHTGKDGEPIKVEDVGAYTRLDRSELNRRIEAQAAPAAGGEP